MLDKWKSMGHVLDDLVPYLVSCAYAGGAKVMLDIVAIREPTHFADKKVRRARAR